jgi:hypothetical protein
MIEATNPSMASEVSIFSGIEEMDHEQVVFCHD